MEDNKYNEKLDQTFNPPQNTIHNKNLNEKELNNNNVGFSEFPEIGGEKYEEEEEPNFPEIQGIDENLNEKENNEEIKDINLEKDNHLSISKLPKTTTTHVTTLFITKKIENIPTINFVQSSVNLNCALDLKDILDKNPNAEYEEKDKFDRVKMWIRREAKLFTFIYPKGKIVCVGGKSVKESKNGCFECANILKSYGYKIKIEEEDIKINNIGATFKVNFKINIIKLYEKLGAKYCVKYDPDIFAGLSCRFEKEGKGGLFIRIFKGGTINITGVKEEKKIYEIFNILYPYLKECKMNL